MVAPLRFERNWLAEHGRKAPGEGARGKDYPARLQLSAILHAQGINACAVVFEAHYLALSTQPPSFLNWSASATTSS